MNDYISIGSDNLVTFETPHDAGSGDAITDASMLAVLKDSEGDTISTATMNYDAEDDQYEGVLLGDELDELNDGEDYFLHIYTSGTVTDYRVVRLPARYRGSC